MQRKILDLPSEDAALFEGMWPREWFERIGVAPRLGQEYVLPTHGDAVKILRAQARDGFWWGVNA